MPLGCPVAPPSQHELHKDGGGDRGGVASGEEGARRPGPEGQVLRRIMRHVLRQVLRHVLRRVLHVLVIYVLLKGKRGDGTRVLGVGSKAALAADRTSSRVGLASRSPRAAAYVASSSNSSLGGVEGGGS